MFTLVKSPNKDFIILNLTDMQMNPSAWNEGDPKGQSVVHTITTLVDRVKPDLITITGDIANGYGEYDDDPYVSVNDSVYENLCTFMDSFGIPWAPISGNHDHFFKCISYFERSENCIFDLGAPELGRGNYIIGIKDGDFGNIIHGLFMMDTHANFSCCKVFNEEKHGWCQFWPDQIEWYDRNVTDLETFGCKNSSVFVHIPIYAFRAAKAAALKEGVNSEKVTLEESYGDEFWNDDFKDSLGVWHEGICAPEKDDGVFEKILERNHTTHVIAGHDHVNNSVVNYKGVCLLYAMKTGLTTYYEEKMNGGTVISIGKDGKITDVHHEYVI